MTAGKALWRCTVSDTSTGNGKVVVNSPMSLDWFTAGPGDTMNWIFAFMGPIEDAFPLDSRRSGAVTILRFRVRK
jgi:hypothetical protein